MSFYGYEMFYVNGTSYTQGGGLEEPEKVGEDGSVYRFYKEIYGTEKWKSRSDVNYGARLSEELGIPCVNEAQSGGSCERMVRMTYNFIWENWDRKDKFFLILENPDGSRSEVYYKGNKSYYIVNSIMDDKQENQIFSYATREYYNKETEKEDYELQPLFKNWYDNHFAIRDNWLKSEMMFVGLYSFCKMNGIRVFVMNANNMIFRDSFNWEDVIKFGNDEKNYDISSWAHDNNHTIKNETNGLSQDEHCGYYGNIEYAKLLKKFLVEKINKTQQKKLI